MGMSQPCWQGLWPCKQVVTPIKLTNRIVAIVVRACWLYETVATSNRGQAQPGGEQRVGPRCTSAKAVYDVVVPPLDSTNIWLA
jgi:hypothetical protein